MNLTLIGLGMLLYGIHDDLHEPPASVERIFYALHGIEAILSTTYEKEEGKIKSYVIRVITYTCYVSESRSFI